MIIAGVLGFVIAILASCSRPSATDFLVGGIYSVTGNEDEFRVVKIVGLSEDIVQIRMYQGHYRHRPDTVDPKMLQPGPMHSGKTLIRMSSLPLRLSEFLDRKPRLIMVTEVTADEQKHLALPTRKL